MNSYNGAAIGGYFELGLPKADIIYSPIPQGAIGLNSARNCLEYILETMHPSKVYIPRYTCDAIIEPFKKTGVSYESYRIDQKLELVDPIDLKSDEMILYVNYFGIKNAYSNSLERRYGPRLIIDASQAFYYKPIGDEKVFYSPRKFFGVPDGGFLIIDKKLPRTLELDTSSFSRMSHLIKRLEGEPENGYQDFKRNEKSLENQPILSMSLLTRKLLSSIDYELIRQRRKDNFKQLHEALGDSNELSFTIDDDAVPLVYPYLNKDADMIRKSLIEHRIFVATYWPNVYSWCVEEDTELYLVNGILPLPIDQRYGGEEMIEIIEVINESIN